MDEKIISLLENLRLIENRANSYRDYFRSLDKPAWRESVLIAEGCETIRHVVNRVERGEGQ
jgi:hypothetical protein